MVAVVVAGILAAAAYPAMTSFIQRSRRADAIGVLTIVVQAQERYRSNHGAYADSVEALNVNVAAAKHYDISLAGVDEPPSFVSGYIVTATPRATSPQAYDTKCTTLGVKLIGSQFYYVATGTDEAHCWPK